MAIYLQCPECWKTRSLKLDVCPGCGCNLKSARKQKKIKYLTKLYYSSIKKQKTEYFDTLKDAQNAERDFLQAKEKQGSDAALYLGEKTTVKELMEWFLKLKKIQKTARYRTRVYFAHEKLISQAIGSYPVAKLSLTVLESFQAELEDNYKSNYVDSIFKTLRQAINRGVDDDQIPMRALKPFRKLKNSMASKNADARCRIISKEEYDILYASVAPHLKPYLALLYMSGMRPAEGLNLLWSQVNLPRRQIILESEDTKTEEPRIIPIIPSLYEILKLHPRTLHCEYVFNWRGRKITDVYTSMRKLSTKVGIPWGRKIRGGWTLHDFRHTWVTNARKVGIAESVIMKITGHKTREMFDRYNFVDETDAMNAGILLTQFFNSFKEESAVK